MTGIRPALVKDSAALNQLSLALGYAAQDQQSAASNLRQILASSVDALWVCERNDRLLGWIHVLIARRVASPQFAEIVGIVVDSGQRRQGIGRLLVAKAQHWAEQHNLPLRVRCNLVRADALAFYQKLGFQQLKQQQVFELSV